MHDDIVSVEITEAGGISDKDIVWAVQLIGKTESSENERSPLSVGKIGIRKRMSPIIESEHLLPGNNLESWRI